MAPNIDSRSIGKESLRKNGRSGGFTLVEILVAIVVLILIVTLLASVNQSVSSGYLKIVNQSRQREEARSILLIMASEIRQALLPVDRSLWSSNGNQPTFQAASVLQGTAFPSIDFLINPKKIVGTAYANPHTLFWQYPVHDSSGTGGSALIGYAVQWQTTASGTYIPVLCRLRSNTGQLFQDLNTSAALFQDWPASPYSAPTSMLSSFAPATPASAYQGWMADYIIALWVRPLDPRGNPITTTAPAFNAPPINLGFNSNGGRSLNFGSVKSMVTSTYFGYDSKQGYRWYPSYPAATPFLDRYPPALPASVEIAIISVTPSALKGLTAPLNPAGVIPQGWPGPLGTDPTKFWDDINTFIASLPVRVRKEARTYSIIVPLARQL